jgi:hypothetical protein
LTTSVADARALPALDQHVAGAHGVGPQVVGVGAVGQVHRAEVVERHHGEVRGALVQVQLVEVRAERRAADRRLDVLAAGDALAAQGRVVRPRRLVLGRGQRRVVGVLDRELRARRVAAGGGAHALWPKNTRWPRLSTLEEQRQLVPGGEGDAQEQRGLGALERRRVEVLPHGVVSRMVWP